MHPFFTTKPPGEGTGIGLSLSDGIARGHGGRIYCNDRSANTQFVLELPKFTESSVAENHDERKAS